MRPIPVLLADPAEPALLPGERRRILLSDPAALALAHEAVRRGHELCLQARVPGEEELLPLATRATIHGARFGPGSVVLAVRGEARVRLVQGGCACEEGSGEFEADEVPEPDEGAFSIWVQILDHLRQLGVRVRLRPAPTLGLSVDRLAILLSPPRYVRSLLLCAPAVADRALRLASHLLELTAPGQSPQQPDLDVPYDSPEDHLDDLVRLYAARARAAAFTSAPEDPLAALAFADERRRRRRAADFLATATAGRIVRRVAASEKAGTLPPLEGIRARHHLPQSALEALLVAGLASSDRFGDRVANAARLLPPGELPVAAWIEALDSAAFGRAA